MQHLVVYTSNTIPLKHETGIYIHPTAAMSGSDIKQIFLPVKYTSL